MKTKKDSLKSLTTDKKKTIQRGRSLQKENQNNQQLLNPEKSILKKNLKYLPLEEKPQPLQIEKRIEDEEDDRSYEIIDIQRPRVSASNSDTKINEPIAPKEEGFLLRPAPLLKLTQMTGYTPSQFNTNVLWLEEGYICYPCGTSIIIMNTETKEQKFLHAELPIAAINVDQSHHRIIAICENRTFYKYDKVNYYHIYHDELGDQPVDENNIQTTKSKQSAEISIWDYHTTQRIRRYTLEGYYGIISMDSVVKNDILNILVCALDHIQRQTIILIVKDQILIKHITQFHVVRCRFWKGKDVTDFISVGKQNIRFWKAKLDSRTIQGHSSYLGEYTRDSNFTDFVINGNRLLVPCTLGKLFGISLETKQVVGVWQIGEAKINAIDVDLSKNLIATAHSDCLIKCWKYDFSEVILQVKCDAEVIGFDANQRGRIVCAQQDRTVGILDIKERCYNYIIHSHRRGIIDICYHNVLSKLITISEDQTIRVWVNQGHNIQQEYEFRCIDSMATVVSCFQKRNEFLVGFENGVIRVFNLKELILTREFKVGKSHIHSIAISPNEQQIIVSIKDETVLLNHQFDTIKNHSYSLGEHGSLRSDFNYDGSLYIVCHTDIIPGRIDIHSCDSYSMLSSISVKQIVKSFNFKSKWNDLLIGVSIDNPTGKGYALRRYRILRGNAQFIQEVSVDSLNICQVVPENHAYLFTVSPKDVTVWDYGFRGDQNGNPERQVYQLQHLLKKAVVANKAGVLFSFAEETGFLLAWNIATSMVETQQNQFDPTMKELDVQRDKVWQGENLERNLEVIKPTTRRNPPVANPQPQAPQPQQPIPSRAKDIYEPIKNMIGQQPISRPSQPQEQEPIIIRDNAFPYTEDDEKLNQINKVFMYGNDLKITETLTSLPWSQENKYYLTYANKYLSFHQFTPGGLRTTLLEQPYPIIKIGNDSSVFYVLLSNNNLRLYDQASKQLIKSLQISCQEVLCLSISICKNYLLVVASQPNILSPHIQIIEISTGKVLSMSVINSASSRTQIFAKFVGGHYDLQFIVLTPTLTQLWRVNTRGGLEYLDLESRANGKPQSASFFQHNNQMLLCVLHGFDLVIYDLRTAKLLMEVKGVTQQQIVNCMISNEFLVILTNSPNIYTIPVQNELKDMFEIPAQIISLDSQPLALSDLVENEIIVASRSGNIWFIDAESRVTLKLNQTVPYSVIINVVRDINSNHMALGCSDGTVRVTDVITQETIVDFVLPKRQCLCLSVLHSGILVAGFDDSFVRFFDSQQRIMVGQCLVDSAVTNIEPIPQLDLIIGSTLNGSVFLVSLGKLEGKYECQIKYVQTELVGQLIEQLQISPFDSQSVFSATTKSGRVQIFERKKLIKEALTLDKNKLKALTVQWYNEDVEYYLADQYRVAKTGTIGMYLTAFSQSDQCQIFFGLNDAIVLRDFRKHITQDVRRVELQGSLVGMTLKDQTIVILLEEQNLLKVFDQETLIETERVTLMVKDGKTAARMQGEYIIQNNLILKWSNKDLKQF